MATYTLRWAKLLNKREAKKEEEILIRNDPRHRSTDRVHLSLSLTLSLSLSSPRVEQYPGCSQSLPNEAHLTRSEYTGHTQTDPSITRSSWSFSPLHLPLIYRNVHLYIGHFDNHPLIGDHRYLSRRYNRRRHIVVRLRDEIFEKISRKGNLGYNFRYNSKNFFNFK